jgi:hypothetical protein
MFHRTNQQNLVNTGGDKVMDVLHRLMSVVEVSQGHAEVSICFDFFSTSENSLSYTEYQQNNKEIKTDIKYHI